MCERVTIDDTIPNIARIYDYFLGGTTNYPCDRELAEQLLRVAPEARTMARDNRAFLGRVVRHLTARGVRQFLDIGTGLPTQENVHQVARRIAPATRVVYVDNDPVVLAHADALLAGDRAVAVAEADLRRPAELLAHPAVRRLLDFDRPLAILLVGIVYFLTDTDRPSDVVATLRDALPPGGYLAMSHVVSDGRSDLLGRAQELYRGFLRRGGDARRTRAQVESFFAGLELVPPGLVYVGNWRPEAETADPLDRSGWLLGAVARKPG
ncbi:S-adenosyl methyltransferase [Amycolatopsis arida]|uniref:S-adenosyl methyltransferase n=1 Tax=Amycolatopsis arida TaxID=587909 RepID=A0A1I5LUN6_9PSEU|nr:SAM-dependent methyltransferase [Amycolatopsis arida]TDX93836.1 S-adenosyl methyltransferase [Amycolatopsis arida]SFP00471.1 S-adenosyl methyltransferase [Amycolatopsis arida]